MTDDRAPSPGLRLRRRLGRRHHGHRRLWLRPGRLAAAPEPHREPGRALRPRHQGQQPRLHPPAGGPRGDTNNLQPRFGFSWDVGNDGKHVVRGGVGLFTGRYLLVPSFTELQQNGVTGRISTPASTACSSACRRSSGSTRTTPRTPASRCRSTRPFSRTAWRPPNRPRPASASLRPGQHRPLRRPRGPLRGGQERVHHPRHQLGQRYTAGGVAIGPTRTTTRSTSTPTTATPSTRPAS